MELESKLLELRLIARKKGKYVINKLLDSGFFANEVVSFCVLCGIESDLTKEHVLPKWVFQNKFDHGFRTHVNKLSRKFIKTTIPLCKKCNGSLLGSLERYVQISVSKVNLENSFYSPNQLENIIRWLEIIDYKFQVLDIITKFNVNKEMGYSKPIAGYSVAFMRELFSIRSVSSKVRLALKRISIKNKSKMLNSLIIGKTKTSTFHYFHKTGKFIHLEIPSCNKMFFYFFDKKYDNSEDALEEAMKIISFAYKDKIPKKDI